MFPTGASIGPGHKLRIAVQAFGAVPGGWLTDRDHIHNSAKYPSALTIPGLR